MDAVPSLHPTDQTLSSFGLGKLDEGSAKAVNQHLEGCADCRKRVAELPADSFLGRVRGAKVDRSTFGQSQSLGAMSVTGATSAPPPPADTLPPGLADHPDYEIKRELGRGGMGVVYLAHNTLMGRDEVLKVMGRQIMERPGVLDRFRREIRSVAKLRHANIVTAHHATRLGESIVFAMEYVDGLDLAKMVKAKGPLPIGHACNFVYQAALGLQHAHEEGLVHRDIKPGNLMLSRKGEKATVKVLDFGLAKVTREEKVDGGLTSEGQALGTPDFIAPEQILDAQSADIRADIYSLGGTLYYLLTGRPPFQEKSLYDTYQAHISRDADPLNIVRPAVPAELAALVAKMMAKDPARRFQTPGEVAEALIPFFKSGRERTSIEASQTAQASTESPPNEPISSWSRPATRGSGPVDRADRIGTASPDETKPAGLIDLSHAESLPAEASSASAPPKHRSWGFWPVVSGLSGLVAIVLGVIVFIATDQGQIKIEVNDPNAFCVIDGKNYRIEGLGEPISLRTGEHVLKIKRGDVEVETRKFFVKRGENEALRIELVSPPKKEGMLATGQHNDQNQSGVMGGRGMMMGTETPKEGTAMGGMSGAMGGRGMMMGTETAKEGTAMGGMMGTETPKEGTAVGMGSMMMGGMMGEMPSPRTKAVEEQLARSIPMNFPEETPLEVVLKHVRAATRAAGGTGIPIYLDPVGIQHPEKKLNTAVTINVTNDPLRGSLDDVLKQVDLAYCVKDGLLFISTSDGVEAEKMVTEELTCDGAPRSKKIVTKLAQPVAMKLPEKTSVLELLKSIKSKSAAMDPKDLSIQIYVDPSVFVNTTDLGPSPPRSAKAESQAENLKSVRVPEDLDHIPLRTTLRLLLAQAELEFSVKKGILKIERKMKMGGMMGGGMAGGGRGMMGGGMAGPMGGRGMMMGGGAGMGGAGMAGMRARGGSEMGMMGGGMAAMGGGMGMQAAEPSPRTKAVETQLARPRRMNFKKTSLDKVLKYVQNPEAGGFRIPFYLDPIGIGELEKKLKSPVTIDLDDIPLNDTLDLVLEQVDLAYCVKDGLLFISTPERVTDEELVPDAPIFDESTESKEIAEKLEKSVAWNIPNKRMTPEELLKDVQKKTKEPKEKPIPYRFSAPGNQEAEKKTSSVTMDLDNVPLRTTLRLLLAQFKMKFSIVKGILVVEAIEAKGGMGGAGMGEMMGPGMRMGGGMGADGGNPGKKSVKKGTAKPKRTTSKKAKAGSRDQD